MGKLDAKRRKRLQATQEKHMLDMGNVLTFDTHGQDAFNVPNGVWLTGPSVKCGFQFANQTREVQNEGDVAQVDAKLRLPVGTKINPNDCFRLTHRFGEPLDVICSFEVVGIPRKGPSGLHVDLAMVTDGRFSKAG